MSADSSEGLVYSEVLEEFTEDFASNFEDNTAPTGMGIESEIPNVRAEDGIMPLADQYQGIISEGLWESIEEELEENVEGYGEDFSFEFEGVKEKGHFEDMPAEMNIGIAESPDEVIDAPAVDWEIGPQIENDSGAFQIDGTGNFGTLLDVLESVKAGTRKYMAQNHPEIVPADQGLTRQFREPGEVPDEVERLDGEGQRDVVKRGVGQDYGRDEALEFIENFYDHFSSIEYCADYIGTIFGPQIMENMFGGSTQLTSGLWHEGDEEIDLDERVSEEMAYRIIFEAGFDALASNVYEEEEGIPERKVGVNQDYWEASAYAQHFLDDADVDEDALDRTGTPWEMIQTVVEEDESFQAMVDHYMTEHNMAWITPPEEEHVEFEDGTPEGFDYDSVALLAVDPDNPKTPREYIEDNEVKFSKVVSDEEGGFEKVTGTVDLSSMDEESAKQYHKANFSQVHIGGMHHDVRPKFKTGGFEYRNARQNYDAEPNVAIAKASVMPHGDKIVDVMQDYGIDPADPETVPDYDDKEAWTEIFSEVYDDEVVETAEEMAPTYADEFQTYVQKRLSDPSEIMSGIDQKRV